MSQKAVQLDAFASPGALLRAARELQGMTQREAADRLNFMPNYVALLERDDYKALRSPSFARGYVKAYGRLLGLDEQQLLSTYDRLIDAPVPRPPSQSRVDSRPLPLQRTGIGVVIGVGVLLLLVAMLWWWEEGRVAQPAPALGNSELSRAAETQQVAGGKR